MCTWDPGMEEVLEFGKIIKIKVPESKPKCLFILFYFLKYISFVKEILNLQE
jgi:hypothetical protein